MSVVHNYSNRLIDVQVEEGDVLTLTAKVGGEPFPEKRHIYWNFVSSSKERIEAAKAMLPYTHKRLGEGGKKEARQGEAEKVAGGRFSAGRPPLRVVGDK